MPHESSIYRKAIDRAMAEGWLSKSDRVLVVCGGPYDKEVLASYGFDDVTISNLDASTSPDRFAPYGWVAQDAEQLTFPDGAFDWVMVHAGLHHCASPHRGLLEMCRVCTKGVIVCEARDSVFMRLAIACSLGTDFELEPLLLSGGTFGGISNGPVPNYVYRWTEREVEKTIKSYWPHLVPEVRFVYHLLVPTQRLAMSRSAAKRALARGLLGVSSVFETLLPTQCNQFGFVVHKGSTLRPWMTNGTGGLKFDEAYANRIYEKSKYRRPDAS